MAARDVGHCEHERKRDETRHAAPKGNQAMSCTDDVNQAAIDVVCPTVFVRFSHMAKPPG
jgi:hypothetical protein